MFVNPDWLAAKELFPRSYIDEAYEKETITVVSAKVTQFVLDWALFSVTQNRFVIEAQREPFEPLIDLMLACIRHGRMSLIDMIGMNRTLHFTTGSEEKRDAFAESFAPRAFWNELLPVEYGEGGKKKRLKTGLLSLTMRHSSYDGERPDKYRGYLNIKVEPSYKIANEKFGVHLEINDHIEFTDTTGDTIAKAADAISAVWQDSFARSDVIMKSLIAKAA